MIEVFLTFLRFGALSFGGGMANLPEMARVLLGNGWVSRQEFADGFAMGQFVPGPNMLAVVFYGLRAAGIGGSVAAMLGMFLPGAVGAIALVWGWEWMQRARWSRTLRKVLVPIGVGLSASIVLTLGLLSLESWFWLLAMLAATALIYRGMPPIAVVLGGAILGWLTVWL